MKSGKKSSSSNQHPPFAASSAHLHILTGIPDPPSFSLAPFYRSNADCSDALVKIKLAFPAGVPASKSTANQASITMQETFTDDFGGDYDPMAVDGRVHGSPPPPCHVCPPPPPCSSSPATCSFSRHPRWPRNDAAAAASSLRNSVEGCRTTSSCVPRGLIAIVRPRTQQRGTTLLYALRHRCTPSRWLMHTHQLMIHAHTHTTIPARTSRPGSTTTPCRPT